MRFVVFIAAVVAAICILVLTIISIVQRNGAAFIMYSFMEYLAICLCVMMYREYRNNY